MPGSFDYEPGSGSFSLASDAAQVGVFRYEPSEGGGFGGGSYEFLPNVVCESIQEREGSRPPVARFRYVLDDSAVANNFPTQFEQLWPTDAFGPYVVRNDDRIVVMANGRSVGELQGATATEETVMRLATHQANELRGAA